MSGSWSSSRFARRRSVPIAGLVVLLGLGPASPALADSGNAPSTHGQSDLRPGNLLVSRSVYENDSGIVAGTTPLPAGCVTGCTPAVADGTYPQVFNNDTVDTSFGITSKAFLDQITPSGSLVNTIEVPNSTQRGVPGPADQMVTSFSSKSEMALNLSTNGQQVTFMGYAAPVGALDVSNSNTPGAIDPTNPVPGAYYRVVAQIDSKGKFRFTETNAYSGNNGRAAILSNQGDANLIYTAGNAGNGANPQPEGVVIGAGAQILKPQVKAMVAQKPGPPTPVGSFSITQLGAPADKIGKDDNFRGMTISNNVLYFTKGSGSNGVDTVYFLDTTGTACPAGVGLPVPGAPLPTSSLAYDASVGLTPNNMCILKGFPTTLAKKSTNSFPFGVWFANADTLYVADEGNGTNTYSAGQYTAAAGQTTAGLQKWVLSAGSWKLAYTLQNGLNLGQPYTVPNYPTGNNPATGLPWAPGTDGLRNVTGRVNPDGTATIWAVTSTVSGNGDQGADPNKLLAVTDALGASSPGSEAFVPVKSAGYGEVLRGVSFTPGTTSSRGD